MIDFIIAISLFGVTTVTLFAVIKRHLNNYRHVDYDLPAIHEQINFYVDFVFQQEIVDEIIRSRKAKEILDVEEIDQLVKTATLKIVEVVPSEINTRFGEHFGGDGTNFLIESIIYRLRSKIEGIK